MKSILLLILINLTVLQHFVSGQTLIPKIGLAISTLKAPESDSDIKNVFGLTGGVAINFPLSQMFSIQPELNYTRKGASSTSEESFIDGDYTFSYKSSGRIFIDYLEVPVIARAGFGDNTRIFLEAGPLFSLGFGRGRTLIKNEYDIYDNGTNLEHEEEQLWCEVIFENNPEDNTDPNDVNAYFGNRFDFGLSIGVGLLLKNKFIITSRYCYGLTKHEFDIQNRSLIFTIGVPFPLSKSL